MIKEEYKNTLINVNKINPYLKDKYNLYKVKFVKNNFIEDIIPLLQKDYGKSLDCTLTSITCLLYYKFNQEIEINTIYNIVEKNAKKYLYDGEKLGTNPLFINKIVFKSFNELKQNSNINCKSRYFKNIFYSMNSIKKLINENNPIIFNIFKDKRDYYNDHTILIIGYSDIRLYKNEEDSYDYSVLLCYDNWNKTVAYVDLDDISLISSINYIKEK